MANPIQCTNSNCQTTIQVPDGTSYVSCPNCGTFYFPSDFDAGSGQNAGAYLPPTDSPPAYDAGNSYGQPIESAPPFAPDVHIWAPETPVFIAPKPVEAVQHRENMPVGFLVKYDGTQLPLKVGSNFIGRKEGDLLIDDKSVSRKHCVIEVSPKSHGGGWDFYISDIGQQTGKASTNGVFIDSRSIRLENYERIPIVHGTTVEIGTIRLRLHIA